MQEVLSNNPPDAVLRQIGSRLVLKPLYVADKKLREVGFYEDLMSTHPEDDWENPSRFVPAYYGIAPVRINGRLIGKTPPFATFC